MISLKTRLLKSNNRVAWPQLSAQRNIQPAQCIDGHAVAGIYQDGRSLGLDDRWPRQGMTGLQAVERIDRHVAPAAEPGLPPGARPALLRRRGQLFVLVALRDFADRGNAGVDEHDFLTTRSISVEFLVAAMEPVFDLVDQIGRLPVQIVEGHVDLKALLPVTHLGGTLDGNGPLEPCAQAAGGLL